MPFLVDHLLMAVLVAVLPAYALYTWKQFQNALASGRPGVRTKAYVETIVAEWALSAIVMGIWYFYKRSWSDLGLVASSNFRFFIVFVVVLIACGFLIRQWIQVRGLGSNIPSSLRDQIEPVANLIPHTMSERQLFILVSITAGICEEILYRGFLIWYLKSYVGVVAGACVSIVIFGLAHSYQGTKSMLKTMIAGAITTAIYLLSGSLIPSMILHAVIDLTSGLIGYQVLNTPKESDTNAASPEM